MIIFIDESLPCLPNRHWRWDTVCHMTSDDLHDLHGFAQKLGLKRAWFQWKEKGLPHYDLTPSKRELAVKLGAIEVDRSGIVGLIREWRQHWGEERLPNPHPARVAQARAAFELALLTRGPEVVKERLDLLEDLDDAYPVKDARNWGVGASRAMCGPDPNGGGR